MSKRSEKKGVDFSWSSPAEQSLAQQIRIELNYSDWFCDVEHFFSLFSGGSPKSWSEKEIQEISDELTQRKLEEDRKNGVIDGEIVEASE